MAIWLQPPSSMGLYPTAPTTAPSLLPSAPPPYMLGGKTTLPYSSPGIWAESGTEGYKIPAEPGLSNSRLQQCLAVVPQSPLHIQSPLLDQSPVIPSSASAHTHLGICFPWPSRHRHPTPNAHMPVSLGSPASQRLVPACTVTVNQQISPSTGLQFLQGGLNPLLSLSFFKHSLLAYTAPYSYLEICTISFPKWLTNSLF